VGESGRAGTGAEPGAGRGRPARRSGADHPRRPHRRGRGPRRACRAWWNPGGRVSRANGHGGIVTALLRSELLKQRSTKTNLWLFSAMLGLVVLVILLHGFGLSAEILGRRPSQLEVLGQGQRVGTLFAALLGAMSITVEFRHGTIRPRFVAAPRRGRVVAAKVGVSMLVGFPFGLMAAAVAAGVGSASLAARGLEIRLDGGDY